MHRSLTTLRACAVLVAAVATLGALPTGAGAQRTATRPWATINVCDPPDRPAAVGVRAFVPSRKGSPAQWLRVRLQFWDAADRTWRRVKEGGDGGWTKVGAGRRGVLGGTTFSFDEPAKGSRIVLRGVVDVEWRLGKRVVDRAGVRTAAGHRNAKEPTLKVSRRSCEIAR